MNRLNWKGQILFCYMLLTIGFLTATLFIKPKVIIKRIQIEFKNQSLVRDIDLDFEKPIVFK